MSIEIQATGYYLTTQLSKPGTPLTQKQILYFEQQICRQMRRAFHGNCDLLDPERWEEKRQIVFNNFPSFFITAAENSNICIDILYRMLNAETILVSIPETFIIIGTVIGKQKLRSGVIGKIKYYINGPRRPISF